LNSPLVILSGGIASRLGALTEKIPKILLPILDRPFIEWQLDLLEKQGFRNLIYCLNHLGEQIEKHVKTNPRKNLKIDFLYDGEYGGTGGAVLNVARNVSNKFYLTYGDSYLPANFSNFRQIFNMSQQESFICLNENQGGRLQNNILMNNNKVKKYSKLLEFNYNYIDYGLAGLNMSTLDLGKFSKTCDLEVILNEIINLDLLVGIPFDEPFFEIGSLEGIKELETKLKESY